MKSAVVIIAKQLTDEDLSDVILELEGMQIGRLLALKTSRIQAVQKEINQLKGRTKNENLRKG